MKIEQAVEVLRVHNIWRRGSNRVEPTSPTLLSKAIDVIINELGADNYTKEEMHDTYYLGVADGNKQFKEYMDAIYKKGVADGEKRRRYRRGAGVMPTSELTRIDKVTRVEVIDEKGRSYSKRNIETVETMLQDSGKTLKLFIS